MSDPAAEETSTEDTGIAPVCPLPGVGAAPPPVAKSCCQPAGADAVDAASAVGVSLDGMPLDTPARVNSLGGARSFRRRLLELGFVPGTTVVVRNVAPLGDPLELELRGCRVSIRRAEASVIQVAPLAGHASTGSHG